ncbi:MAG: histidinol-phosphate transaminase [Ilumatobacteraceae bacterium]
MTSTPQSIGRPRPVVSSLPAYKPGKDAKQAEVDHGVTDAIKLASNENPEAPIDPVITAVQSAIVGVNRYADHRAVALRARIGEWLSIDPSMVTVGNGSVGILQQIFLTYVDPGDEVVFGWRSFEVYPIFTQLAGGTAVRVPLTADLDYDIDAIISSITERTKLVMLATPNNPTGTIIDIADLERIAEAAGSGAIVVVDEAYREFVGDDVADPVHALIERHPNVMVTRTLSKAHGLAGLRMGYAVAHPTVIADFDKCTLPFAVNGLAQVAAMAAIDNIEMINERARGIVAERGRVEAALRQHGWWLPAHRANFVYLDCGDRTGEITLSLERSGVVVRPFEGEGIRVTIGSAVENDRFMTAMAEIEPARRPA